jgi:SAM-dependent methyltransferase
MSAQDDTLDRYHNLMQINAQAHLIKAAREAGIFDALRQGQATSEQLIERLGLEPRRTQLLLDAMVALQAIEKYGDDYALAAVTRLLCEYDADLGDDVWGSVVKQLRGAAGGDRSDYFDEATATQWVHTAAAKQTAEILDIAGERTGKHILDWGCGSAVWSVAMAFVDPATRVTAVDTPSRLAAARRTIDSIELGSRYEFIEADPNDFIPQVEAFDLVMLAGRISGHAVAEDVTVISKARDALKPGGELVIIDLFRGPGRPGLNESIEAMRLAASTPDGHIRDAEQTRNLLLENGFGACQFAFIAASRQGWGLLLATKKT